MPQLLLAWFVRDTRAGWYNGTSLDVLQCYINMQDMLLRLLFTTILVPVWPQLHQERPYNHDSTASRLLSEVKHDLARLVLRWGTTLESLVLFFFLFCLSPLATPLKHPLGCDLKTYRRYHNMIGLIDFRSQISFQFLNHPIHSFDENIYRLEGHGNEYHYVGTR